MPYDAFLKLEGVPGESTREGFEEQIEVESLNFGVNNPTSSGPGAGRGAGKASISPISISKQVDKASPKLFDACTHGKHFPTAEITFHRSGGDEAVDYLVYKLEKVYVSDYQINGTSGMEDRPREQISLDFGKVEVTYTPQTETGAKGGPVVAAYDILKNA